MANPQPSEDPPFGPSHIIQPQSEHTHTAIILHRRGSNGAEFGEEFMSSHLSDGASLAAKLPSWRWVFPSSQALWSTTFQECLPAWFEAHSLTDITARQDLQICGIKDSVRYINGIIDQEAAILGRKAGNMLLGGISQGGAIALWTLLSQSGHCKFGGFFASNTWLPFAENLERVLRLSSNAPEKLPETEAEDAEFDTFASHMLKSEDDLADFCASVTQRFPRNTFLGHGTDDAYVDVNLGRQARNALSRIGVHVDWREYSGAGEEGHWFKVPQQMDDIQRFITRLTLRKNI